MASGAGVGALGTTEERNTTVNRKAIMEPSLPEAKVNALCGFLVSSSSDCSFIRCLLSSCCVPGAVLGPGDTLWTESAQILTFSKPTAQERKDSVKEETDPLMSAGEKLVLS